MRDENSIFEIFWYFFNGVGFCFIMAYLIISVVYFGVCIVILFLGGIENPDAIQQAFSYSTIKTIIFTPGAFIFFTFIGFAFSKNLEL